MTITLKDLKWGHINGAVKGVTLRADGNAFKAVIRTKEGDKTLITARKGIRRFSSAQTALHQLHDIGVSNVQVDLADWKPRKSGDAPFDPARSERMTQHHAAEKNLHSAVSDKAPGSSEPVAHVASKNLPVSSENATGQDIASAAREKNKLKAQPKTGVPFPMDVDKSQIYSESHLIASDSSAVSGVAPIGQPVETTPRPKIQVEVRKKRPARNN